jgi:amino acid transporter
MGVGAAQHSSNKETSRKTKYMATHAKTKGKGRFGTFAGVFTPTVLTILGLILFLRIGWVVGRTGLLGALVIIALANLISFLTGLSLSSIATNMHVKTGGTYYIISRTLGLEIGGAIGIPLYFSQAISVAFYIIGFTEAFTATFTVFDPTILAALLVLAFGFLAFVGADFVLKIQFLILALMALSIGSFFMGGWDRPISPQLFPAEGLNGGAFWQAFAVFFPAVTGIAVGVSMSGDLRDPAKSIPRGTLAAIGITFIVYLACAFWLATHAATEELLADHLIMKKVARWPLLILLGVWASTLSSALGSVLAAPRTLQSLSFDRVVPGLFGNQLGSATEPRVAVLITIIIALAVALMGNLNFVAPIITMFFLNTYGMINLAAGIEGLVGNPSFRPQFKVHWIFCVLGAMGCYGTMLLIHMPATVAAILISYGFFIALKRRTMRRDWDDVRRGLWFTLSRFGLIQLESMPWHAKNWRPNIMVFAGQAHRRAELMELGTWLSGGRGIVTFFHFLVGDTDRLAGRGLRETSRSHIRKYLQERKVSAFAECSIVSDLHEGIFTALQIHGVAGLEPNAALLGWSSNWEVQKNQLKLMRKIIALKKSVLFFHLNEKKGFGRKKQIDVWWRGRDRNVEMMLLLAHIIHLSPPWAGSRIRVIRLIESEQGKKGAERHIEELLRAVRVKAEAVVLIRSTSGQSFSSVLRQACVATDLTLLGIRFPEDNNLWDQAREITDLLQSVCTAILVRSGEVEDILEGGSSAHRL